MRLSVFRLYKDSEPNWFQRELVDQSLISNSSYGVYSREIVIEDRKEKVLALAVACDSSEENEGNLSLTLFSEQRAGFTSLEELLEPEAESKTLPTSYRKRENIIALK